MTRTGTLTTTTALLAAFFVMGGIALAQDYGAPPPPPGGDPYGYYSQYDHQGYYDREGHYERFKQGEYPQPGDPDSSDGDNGDYAGPPPPPPPTSYYEQERYERECRRGNTAAGTIFGAIAGGLLGSAAGHGRGGAVVGGAVLGGMLGNAVGRNIDCEDQPYAFRAYASGLNGEIGYRTEWRHGNARGYFVPTREFRRGTYACRTFTETTYARGRSFTHTGTACRHLDGNWYFD
jgi:surface antigen